VKARKFLEAARRFVVDTRFAELIASQQLVYDTTNSRLRAPVDGGVDLPWLDRFFGARPPVRFYVIPGLIYAPVKEAMRRRAYGDPRIRIDESLVRATARYYAAHEGEESARRSVESERKRSVLWVGELSDLPGEYEKQRDRYPKLEVLMPEVVKLF
jgi:DNA-dependent RNA polymerase auxiliary subunit epsilon